MIDRAPVSSEDKYTAKTLEGNWFERRVVDIPQSVTWRTTYDTDYTPHVNKTWKENQVTKWDNKLNLEVYEYNIFKGCTLKQRTESTQYAL